MAASLKRREGHDALVCLYRSRAGLGYVCRRRCCWLCRAEFETAFAQKALRKSTSVDVELILAVDVSYSMDLEELAVQREGYAQALISSDFLEGAEDRSARQGRHYLFRMGGGKRPEGHHSLAHRRRAGNRRRGRSRNHEGAVRRASRTSISGAINFGMELFADNPYKGLRRVIDISGDGPNNNGEPVPTRAMPRWRRA